MIIYLDNCCYNRPFDDQTQERIHLESEAILTILKIGQMKRVVIVGSEILELEINRMLDENKKHKVLDLYTDDKFEKMSEKLDLKIRVLNPLRFAWEVI